MEQAHQTAQGQREFPAAGREDVFQRALVGFAPGAQLGVGLMQLGEILLQGLDGLLLVSRSLFQLVEVLLLADAGLLEILYALENGGEQWVVSQRLQREVAVAHAQLHPGGETVQTFQHEIRVVVEEQDAVAVIKQITGKGAHYAVETTGVSAIVLQAVHAVKPLGTVAIVGFTGDITLNVQNDLMAEGKSLVGVIEGDAVPALFIPLLVQLYKQGKFPIDKLIARYPLADINQAFADSASGKVIKPVVVM